MMEVSTPITGRWAVLADIHGNSWALAAVLADARAAGATRVVDLGDTYYGPLDPAGTAALLARLDLPLTSVRGNEDRALATPGEASHPSLAFTLLHLDAAEASRTAARPTTAEIEGVLLCHGTPFDDSVYLLEEVTPDGARSCDTSAVNAVLDTVPAPLVLCGHSHLARCVTLDGGRLVVNPGSVGLPAYRDDSPHPHRMEAGSPHARYALVEAGASGVRVALLAVPYDHEAAARAAVAHGREDWARALRTGRAG